MRDRRLAGFKIRRQHAVASYSLDFYCAKAKLAVEVDGAVHADPDQQAADALRTRHLNELGIRILRLPNELVLNHPSAMCDRILDALTNPTSKPPSAHRRWERGLGVRDRGRGTVPGVRPA